LKNKTFNGELYWTGQGGFTAFHILLCNQTTVFMYAELLNNLLT